MTTTTDYDFEDDGPVLTEAEKRYAEKLNEVYDRYHHDGERSYEVAITACGYCPAVVMIRDWEGYETDGRCLADIVDTELGLCEGHAEEIRSWRSMSEPERAEWERRQDEPF